MVSFTIGSTCSIMALNLLYNSYKYSKDRGGIDSFPLQQVLPSMHCPHWCPWPKFTSTCFTKTCRNPSKFAVWTAAWCSWIFQFSYGKFGISKWHRNVSNLLSSKLQICCYNVFITSDSEAIEQCYMGMRQKGVTCCNIHKYERC